MLNLIDRDIAYTSRRSEYSYDVYVEGCWMASAKGYHSADETADEVQYRGFVTACVTPPNDPAPSDGPGDSIPGDPGYEYPRCACGALATTEVAFANEPHYEYFCDACFAPTYYIGDALPQAVTLQSREIEARITTCANCRGIHHIQACPQLRAAVAASLSPVELGASLCGMLWCDPADFVRLLTRSTPARRAAYASAYIAFLRSERGWCDVTIADVLARWLPADRGPAGMAVLERAA